MSRAAVNTADTPRPGAVSVTCDNCGGRFTTDETTAYTADQNDEDLLCKPCKNGQPAPPSKGLVTHRMSETAVPHQENRDGPAHYLRPNYSGPIRLDTPRICAGYKL
ncbi:MULTISPECIES: hypothetical protein [Haloarcula]|uniref:hypothetical protein n=1 Tax=Haloarcula TaxID=2237 RepID=UPI001F499372|nr:MULTISPECIES: hypothetical protein [Haloarcula]